MQPTIAEGLRCYTVQTALAHPASARVGMMMVAPLPRRLPRAGHSTPERVQLGVVGGADRQHPVQIRKLGAALLDRDDVMDMQQVRAVAPEEAPEGAAVTVAL
jgi:hypothetical protein